VPYKTLYWKKTEGRWGWRRRHKQLLDNLLDKGLFCKLIYEATNRPLLRIRLGRDYGQTCRNTDNRRNVS